MKTLLLITSGMLLTISAVAQTQKGNGIVSGNVAINYNRLERSTPGPTTWAPGLRLTVGRFWMDNWLAGLSLSGDASITRQPMSQNPDQTYPTTSTSAGTTPFVRKYWTFNTIYLFAGAGLSVYGTSRKQSYFNGNGQFVENGIKYTSLSINPRLEAGVNYFVTNRLGLQLVAGANSLPLNVVSLNAGLVYWTGADRRAALPEERNNPQTEPGKWVIEGDFSLTSQNNSQLESLGRGTYQVTTKTYSFNPSLGFFIKKNSLLGVSIPISYLLNRSVDGGSSTTDNTLWGIGIAPYFQHYWTSTRLTPYTRMSVGYTHYSSDSDGGSNLNGNIGIGLAYMAGSRFIIETSLANASVSYLVADRSSGTDTDKSWNAGISAGLTGNFAIRYVLQ